MDPLSIIIPGSTKMTQEERVQMTVSCRDTDQIPKKENAGHIIDNDIQIMHNGAKVMKGGYHGDWMAKIISLLRGHHEPQEEVCFYEILKKMRANAKMIELGSFWAYYSIWFNMEVPNAQNICCEPDLGNLNIGKKNCDINELSDIIFYQSAAGLHDGEDITISSESNQGEKITVQIQSVDGIMNRSGWEYLDILHVDTQGAELDALKGTLRTIENGKLRFVVISTHHYSISHDPNMHQKCLDYILERGGHIISSHTVPESFSGDGLIVASFADEDKDFIIETSINHTDNSLFRASEKDIEMLCNYIEKESNE